MGVDNEKIEHEKAKCRMKKDERFGFCNFQLTDLFRSHHYREPGGVLI